MNRLTNFLINAPLPLVVAAIAITSLVTALIVADLFCAMIRLM